MLCIFFSVFLIQCEEPSIIGFEVQPLSDNLNILYTDTLSVVAYTKREDSLRSEKTLYALLGSISEQTFGKSQASFCTQLNLPSSNVIFPENITIDSLILSLVLKGYYGNDKYINPLRISVYEINTKLYPDSSYYSNFEVEKKSLIGSKICFPNVKDSVYVDGAVMPPHLRIPLHNSLAKRFVEDAYRGYLANNATFTDYFRGLLVETMPVSFGGSIFYFDLLSPSSKVTFYYTQKNDGNEEKKSLNFLINTHCARFNIFKHDYSFASSDFQSQLSSDSAQATEKLYLQTRAGTKINIYFPTLRNLAEIYPILINKAELVFKIDDTDFTSNIYPVPLRLTLVKYNEDGGYGFIADHASAFFGGEFDKINKEYRFNITRHIQNVIKENTEDYGIALLIAGASTRGDRVILQGMLDDEMKPKIYVTYTLIK